MGVLCKLPFLNLVAMILPPWEDIPNPPTKKQNSPRETVGYGGPFAIFHGSSRPSTATERLLKVLWIHMRRAKKRAKKRWRQRWGDLGGWETWNQRNVETWNPPMMDSHGKMVCYTYMDGWFLW